MACARGGSHHASLACSMAALITCGRLFRVLRAMAQARGVPLSRVFQALSVVTKTPINAVWAMAALAFLLGLPLLYSSTVFSAIASISSLGLYVSCESLPPQSAPLAVYLSKSESLLPLLHSSSVFSAIAYLSAFGLCVSCMSWRRKPQRLQCGVHQCTGAPLGAAGAWLHKKSKRRIRSGDLDCKADVGATPAFPRPQQECSQHVCCAYP